MKSSSHKLPIVVGIENEQHGLLDYAASWAERWQVPLHVRHSFTFRDIAAELYVSKGDGATPLIRSQEILEDARVYLEQRGLVNVEVGVDDGPAALTLEMVSKHASAVVVGSAEKPPLQQFVAPGVIRHLANHAHSPIFVVPGSASESHVEEVVLEIDAHHVTEGPLRFAFETADHLSAHLQIMHVVPHTEYQDDPVGSGAQLIAIADRWSAMYPGVVVSPTLVRGDVEDEALIASKSAQLMVVGRPNDPPHRRLFGLHVAENIARKAQCPVVIVPAEYRWPATGSV